MTDPLIRAFLCDDVEELRELLRFGLESDGDIEVVGEAPEPITGVPMIAELKPDVVLLDLSMPGMDGYDAIPKIREASPGSAIIVFSGFLDSKIGRLSVERGADAFLSKGVPLETLRGKTREVVAARAQGGGNP